MVLLDDSVGLPSADKFGCVYGNCFLLVPQVQKNKKEILTIQTDRGQPTRIKKSK